MTIESRLAEIRARVENATPGPWENDGGEISQHWSRPEPWLPVVSTDVACISYCYGGSASGVENEADAEFIAASRTDLPALLAAVEAVMGLHKCLTFPDDGIGEPTACGYCDNETWPCPTVRDITTALEAQDTTREDQTND